MVFIRSFRTRQVDSMARRVVTQLWLSWEAFRIGEVGGAQWAAGARGFVRLPLWFTHEQVTQVATLVRAQNDYHGIPVRVVAGPRRTLLMLPDLESVPADRSADDSGVLGELASQTG